MITTEQLASCDREPIHALSRVQQNGVLFVVSYETLQILQASENCYPLTKTPAQEMLNRSLADFFDPVLLSNIRNTLSDLSFHHTNFGTLCERDNEQNIFCVIHREENYFILEIDYFKYASIHPLSSEDIVQKAIETFEVHETLEDLAFTIAKSVREIS